MLVHAQENIPAPKRSSRKRGAPAPALDAITEEEQTEEDTESKPEVPAEAKAAVQAAPDTNAQEAAPAGNAGAVGKPPLPGRARRGRAAKKEEAEEGMQLLRSPNSGSLFCVLQQSGDSLCQMSCSL